MKQVLASIFCFFSVASLAQIPGISTLVVEAERETHWASTAYFNRMEENEVFTIAHRWDTLFVSVLDTCGTEKKSSTIPFPVLSSQETWSSPYFKALRRDDGTYIVCGLHHGSNNKALVYELNRNLDPVRMYNFNKINGPLASSTTWQSLNIDFLPSSNQRSYLLSARNSADGRNNNGVLDIWLIDQNSGTEHQVFLEHVNKNRKLETTAMNVTNNEILLAGCVKDLQENFVFIAKLDLDFNLQFYHEYEVGNINGEPLEGFFIPHSIHVSSSGMITLMADQKSLPGFGMFSFHRNGHRPSAQYFEIQGSNTVVCPPINSEHEPNTTYTFANISNGRNPYSILVKQKDESAPEFFQIPFSLTPKWNGFMADQSINGPVWRNNYYDRNHQNHLGFSQLSNSVQPSCDSGQKLDLVSTSLILPLKWIPLDSVNVVRSSADVKVAPKTLPQGPPVKWFLVESCHNLFTNSTFPATTTYRCHENPVALKTRFSGDRYSWSTGDSTAQIEVDSIEKYVCKVRTGLCTTVDTQYLAQIDSIALLLPADTTVCPETRVTLAPKGNKPDYDLEWITPGMSRQRGWKLEAKDSGWYRIRAVGSGCKPFDSTLLAFHPKPIADAGPDGNICRNDTFQIQGDGGDTFKWTPATYLNHDSIKNPKAFPPNTQLYQLITASKQGCRDTDFVTLFVHPNPLAHFSTKALNPRIGQGPVKFVNLGGSHASFTWFVNGEGVSTEADLHFNFPDTGTFFVMLKAETTHGCVDSTSIKVKVDPVPLMFLPNAFTPDGNGINEQFAPSTFYFKQYEMCIYSRWGQVVWKSRPASAFPAWDGTTDDSTEAVPLGTYLYIIKGIDQEGQAHQYSGKVHVVR